MKRAIVTQTFRDIKEGALREYGSAFLVDDERGEYLRQQGLVELRDAAPEPAPAPKKRATKKK